MSGELRLPSQTRNGGRALDKARGFARGRGGGLGAGKLGCHDSTRDCLTARVGLVAGCERFGVYVARI